MQDRNTILVVDDVESTREYIKNLFKDKYKILEAADGAEAIDVLHENGENIILAVLDIIMPVADGFAVAQEMSEDAVLCKIPVVFITAANGLEYEKKGYSLGCCDIISKQQFAPYIVKKRLENIIDLYNHKNKLEMIIKEQTRILNLQEEKIRKANDFVIESLSTVVEFRDLESGEHIKRIKKFTNILLNRIADEQNSYDLNDYLISIITSASAMHDIGKIAIPDSVLLKPGRLNPDEFEIIKKHTVSGCEILTNLSFINNDDFYNVCYSICRSHHERWDGKGYPDGLKGDEIPISAQVVSVADVYDALVSERVYKKAIPHDEAIEMIITGKCGCFSEFILENLVSVESQFREYAAQSNVYKPMNF